MCGVSMWGVCTCMYPGACVCLGVWGGGARDDSA